jgi:hypothetical protein
MQDKMAAFTLKRKPGFTIYSVNGDCSKWSAAETLECFTAFNYGLSDVLPPVIIKYLNHVSYTWANKYITIPSSILRTTSYITETTEYLKKLDSYKFKSTQNFLQGMMNYASSLKAVALANLSKKIFKKLYPKSTLDMDHMEHSDDYIHLIICENTDDLKAFRKVHKIVMKLGGINDSYKKTNVQKYFMEFISLVNFNGQLIYPHIKKTKETGLNTACSGYIDDMAFATSRAGECVRIGVPTAESYAMMRIQSLNIARSYSILPGMHNEVWDMQTIFNMPTECFGVPDVLPTLLPFVSGNTNNYRLRMYGSPIAKKIFTTCLLLGANAHRIKPRSVRI